MEFIKIILLISFFFMSKTNFGQVDFLNDISWEDAKEMSHETGKPIFIDIYTDWCGPCKRMDKTTFQDEKLGNMMNESFVNLKINAEKNEYLDLMEKFKINSYPTYIFANSNGDIISKEKGYKTVKQLDEICNKLKETLQNNRIFDLDPTALSKLSNDELENIVKEYSNYNFESKEALKDMFYHELENGNSVSSSIFDFLLNNYELDDKYSLLVDNFPSNFSALQRTQMEIKFKAMFSYLYHSAIIEDDILKFNQIAENHKKISNISLKFLEYFNEPSKIMRTQKLLFYFTNSDFDNYFSLADTLINEYIKPIKLSMVKKQDELMKSSMNGFFGIDKDAETSELSDRDSLGLKHFNAKKIADRLNQISQNVFLNINDQKSQLKALEWINLSLTFIDLPETHLIKAAILKKDGKIKESESEIKLARESPYFDDFCKTKLVELNL